MASHDGYITIENGELLYRNFEGRESDMNRKGDRNFCVILNPDLAEQLERDGWNVKYRKPRSEDEIPTPYLQVTVGYKIRPPAVFMITSRGRTPLGEDEVEMLDWVDFDMVDLVIRPYAWNIGGRSGISAYLKGFYGTIAEDDMEKKYANVPLAQTPREVEQEIQQAQDERPPW